MAVRGGTMPLPADASILRVPGMPPIVPMTFELLDLPTQIT